MCGIAGFFSESPFETEMLLRVSQRMKHRGPDGEGFVTWDAEGKAKPCFGNETPENCRSSRFSWLPQHALSASEPIFGAFIHRRLAIIAPDAQGYQPQSFASGRYWITYNGEIYNYPELRSELEGLGVRFQTASDTEVILAAFAQWGADCLNRFNGMWAFAIYDSETRTVFAARDRFGVKPFYYNHSKGKFAFGSEYKTLLASGWMGKELNADAVFDYFVFSEIEYQPEGFFKEIRELRPGHWLRLDLRTMQVSETQWYALQAVADDAAPRWSWDEIVSETRNRIEDAVRLRLRADVEVGSCLSGGLDSSAIVALMRKHLPQAHPLHVFTAVFPNQTVDESSWARMMAESAQAISHETAPDGASLLEDLSEMSYALDLPIWSTSTYAQFRVMRLVAESGLKVVLDGQGGDELFGGYANHLYFWKKGWGSAMPKADYEAGGGAGFYRRQWLRYEGIFKGGNRLASMVYRRYFPGLDLLNAAFYRQHTDRFALPAQRRWDDLNSRLAWEMQNTSLKAYLRCEDRTSMWFGVESRTPFADDPNLAEWVFSLPGKLKIQEGLGKHLMREALHGVLPETVRQRRDKKGYATPNNVWISQMAPHLKSYFEQPELQPFIDRAKLDKVYASFFNPQHDRDDGRLFKFISFAVWMHRLRDF
jgi:asparagine synthase (glutamine-hydrolysing)